MIFPYKPWTLKETLTVGLFIRPDRGKLWEFRYPDGSVAYSFDIGHYENRIAELERAVEEVKRLHSDGGWCDICCELPCETAAIVTPVVHNAEESGDFRKEGS